MCCSSQQLWFELSHIENITRLDARTTLSSHRLKSQNHLVQHSKQFHRKFYNNCVKFCILIGLISMVSKITYNGNDVTRIVPGTHFNDFRNDFKKIFLSHLRSPSIAFVIVKNKYTSFFHAMYSYLPQKWRHKMFKTWQWNHLPNGSLLHLSFEHFMASFLW